MRRANFGCQSFHLFLRFFFFSFHSSFYTPHPRGEHQRASPTHMSNAANSYYPACCNVRKTDPYLQLSSSRQWPLPLKHASASAAMTSETFIYNHIYIYIYTCHISIYYIPISLSLYIYIYAHMNKHHMLKFTKIRKVSSIAAAAAWAVTPQDTAPWCRVFPGHPAIET